VGSSHRCVDGELLHQGHESGLKLAALVMYQLPWGSVKLKPMLQELGGHVVTCLEKCSLMHACPQAEYAHAHILLFSNIPQILQIHM
jgi:hypothetical protein